jgi:hypothetical protein
MSLGTVPKHLLHHFVNHLPEWIGKTGHIPEKYDLALLSKRLGIEYGFSYRPNKTQLIRKDLFEFYQILRDKEETPWKVFELDGGWRRPGEPTGDSYLRDVMPEDRFGGLWRQFRRREYDFALSGPVVPLFQHSRYCEYYLIRRAYPNVSLEHMQEAGKRFRVERFKGFESKAHNSEGVLASKSRPTLYRKDLALWLHWELPLPAQTSNQADLILACDENGINDVYPQFKSRRPR